MLQAVGEDGLGPTQWSFGGDGHLSSAPVVTSNAVWVGSTSGEIYELSCATGAAQWSTNVGSPIYAPDEQNVSSPLTGLGVGANTLIVPAGSTLVAYTSSSTTGAGSCGPFTGSSSQPAGTGSTPPQPASSNTAPTKQATGPSLSTREATLLHGELALHTTVRHLLTHHQTTLTVVALQPGRLTLAWVLSPAGAGSRHPVRVAMTVRMKRAGIVHLTLRLSAAAVQTLRLAHHGVQVAATATFVPNHGRTVTVRRSFRIAR
jgi:hypothetical protein